MPSDFKKTNYMPVRQSYSMTVPVISKTQSSPTSETIKLKNCLGTSLVAQWIGLRTPNAGDPGSIPGQGTRSHVHAAIKSSHAATKEPECRK